VEISVTLYLLVSWLVFEVLVFFESARLFEYHSHSGRSDDGRPLLSCITVNLERYGTIRTFYQIIMNIRNIYEKR
jgi:hypothetical protein